MRRAVLAALTVAAACAVLVLLLRGRVSSFQANKNVSYELVVSRFAEDLDFLDDDPFSAFGSVLVYNKSDKAVALPARAREIKLPNVGREGHTYLHHIIHNWDRLADVTAFVPASCAAMPSKLRKARWVAEHALATQNSAFPDQEVASLMEEWGDFKVDQYKSSDAQNAARNPESSLAPSRYRPLRAWMEAHGMPDVDGVTYNGIFAVSRAHIRSNPREFYEELIRDLEGHSSPEAGHFLERSWLSVFHSVPPECRRTTSQNSVTRTINEYMFNG